MLRTMSHEMIHMAKQMSPGYFERYSDFIFDNFLSENADELIFRRQRQYEKANNGKKLSYNEAMEEVVADASEMFLKGFLGLKVELGNQAGEGRVDMETVTEDLQKPKYKGVLRILGNVIDRMKRKISAFKRAWNGAQAKTEEGKTVSAGDAKAYEQAQQMFNELILRASANYKLLKDGQWESDSEKSERSSMRDNAEGVRFALPETDSDGKLLSDGQRKYFNGTKVVDTNGNLLRVYHGSPAMFTEFSYQFMSRNGSSEGQGIYFTQNKDMAEGYTKKGGQLLEGYLSIKKPLSDSEITLTPTEVKRLIQAVDPTGDDVLINYDSMGGMGYPSKTWYNRALADTVSSCMEYCNSDSEILANIANSGAGAETVLLTAKRVLGYDGYIVDGKYENSTVYVAFASDQFKNADNRNPTDNPDIRYSERGNGYDGYAMSNNARDAYERGEMPLSRWTKQKVINQIAQDNGVSPEDVSLEFPYEHYLEKAGWHHTSSKYNKTYFYYVTDDTSGVIFSERAKEKIQSDKIEQAKKYLEENKENLKKAEAWKPEITEDDQYYYIRELDNHNGIYNKNYTTKEKVILRTEEKVQEKISYLKQRIENQEKQIRDLSNSENFRYSTRAEEVDFEERKVYNRKKSARYIQFEKVGNEVVRHIRSELKKIYGNSDGVADGIAIEHGNDVYIVDSGRENGSITFGIRKRIRITRADLRADFIRRKNNDAVSNGYISDGLSQQIGNGLGRDWGRNMRRKSGTEFQIDSRESGDNQRGVSGEDADIGRLKDSSRTFADSLTEPTKYQTRDGSATDYVTSRLALAEAFEQIATNQRERNWAARYRERAEELAGYNTRLRELWKDYFTKGHSAAERAEIRTQIRSLTQKIQTADGGLTQFVNAKPLAAYVTRVQNEVARQERENSRAKLAEFRKSENALVRSILEEHRQKLAQRRAAGERQNVIDKMVRLSGKFLSMLEHPAEGSAKHFNAGIVRSALEVLDTLGNGDIDLQRKMEERAAKIAKIEAEMENLATGENAEEPRVLDHIEELRGQKQRLETYLIGNTQNANALKEKLAELRERYESDDFKNTGEYDETISQMLKYLREEIAGKPVSELTTEQLQKAYDIMKAIYKTSTDANKLIGSKFRESVEELSHDFIGDMEKSGHKNRKYIDPYFVMQLRPRTFFSYLSGGKGEGSAAVKLYNMLNDGQTQMLTIKRDAYLLFSDLINGKQNRENIDNMAEMVDIGLKDRNGKKVEISRGMMITLYMHLQNEQNAAHFMMGGLTVPNMKAYYKGDYDGAFRSGTDQRVYGLANAVFQLQEQLETTRADLEAARALKNNKLAAELEGRISGLESSLATAKAEMMVKAKELSDQIEKKFTAYERRYVEAAKAFFWEFSGDTLNKTAMERYGFNRFTVKNYFPIQTDTRYLMSAKADMATFSKNFSLEAMGMTKDRVGATNPLLLLDISAIVDRHINDISLYAGFVQAVHNFNKVYNFTDKNYQKSVKAEINDYFGASATKYIDKLLLDIAGARRQEPNVLDKFRSNYAGAVLAVNAGVTLKQAASLPTAAAVLGWKNMGTATARFAKDWASKKNWRETFETIQKYTPLLWYRQRGYMDADIGDIYRGKSISDTVTGKVPWLMNWITAMDAHTVGSLWYACEENVKDSNKALQVGSEEYYKEVAKLFNQVTYDTQPNYTVMQRPDILRNPNALVRALFMFKTQIMQNFNILAEACMEYGYARKNFEKGSAQMRAAKVKLSRAITSQLVAALIIALIDGTRKLLRRNLMGLGKEIEITHIPLEYANAFMSSLFGTFVGGTEIYEMVYSIVSGDRYYGFGDVDAVGVPADIATEIVNISKSAINGDFEWQDLEGFAGKLARAFGLPVENILKILKGLYNLSTKIIEG